MLLTPFTLWLCAMEGTSWGIRIQLSQLSHRNMNRKEAVKLIYKCVNYQCQNLELSEGSWWASFTWSVPNATGSFTSLWLCLHTSLIHTLASSSSSYAFLSHTSLSQSEQDEDHFSNKTKFKKNVYTYVPLHATLLNRASCWIEVLFTSRIGKILHWVCTYIFKLTSLKCRTPKITSECWAEVIHGQKDTWCSSEVVKTGYAWTEIKGLLNAKDWPGFICV